MLFTKIIWYCHVIYFGLLVDEGSHVFLQGAQHVRFFSFFYPIKFQNLDAPLAIDPQHSEPQSSDRPPVGRHILEQVIRPGYSVDEGAHDFFTRRSLDIVLAPCRARNTLF